MDTTDLLTKFARIGARLKVADRPTRRSRVPLGLLSLDVQADRNGEFFEVVAPGGGDPEVAVLDVRPAERHLLLMVRDGGEKHKYLCGHDERHWFVAAVPDAAPVGTVLQAKEALKPAEVRSAQASKRLGAEAGNRRKNAAYRRQGEWFFLPAPGFVVDEALVLRNEPLRRGDGGKPHWTSGPLGGQNTPNTNVGRDFGMGYPAWIYLLFIAGVAPTTGTVDIQLVSSASPALTSPNVMLDLTGGPIAGTSNKLANLSALRFPLPRAGVGGTTGWLRYLGVNFIVATSALTAGTVNCFLTRDVQDNLFYAAGYLVQ